jgi:hypothetical protein
LLGDEFTMLDLRSLYETTFAVEMAGAVIPPE